MRDLTIEAAEYHTLGAKWQTEHCWAVGPLCTLCLCLAKSPSMHCPGTPTSIEMDNAVIDGNADFVDGSFVIGVLSVAVARAEHRMNRDAKNG